MLSVSCSVMRRDFFDRLGGFDPLCQSNDWVLNIRIFRHLISREQFSYILDPVFAYRMHANNISKDQNKMITLLTQVVDRYIPIEYREQQYANIYFYSSLNLIVQGQYRQSLRLFRAVHTHGLQFARVLIYCLALVSPARFIADRFPRVFTFIRQIIQRING